MFTWDAEIDVARVDVALGERPATYAELMVLAGRVGVSIPELLRTDVARDPRWRMALRHASGGGVIPNSSATKLGRVEHLAQLVELDDGYLGLCYEHRAQDATLVRLGPDFTVRASRQLPGLLGRMAVLPRALRNTRHAILVLYTSNTPERFCYLLDDELRVASRASVRVNEPRSEVRWYERVGDEIVIEGLKEMWWATLGEAPDELLFPSSDDSLQPARRSLSESYFGFFRRRLPVWVDGWLVMAGSPELIKGKGWVSREMHWVDLDRDRVHTTAWPQSATGWAVHQRALWITSDDGLHRCEPASDVELVRAKKREYYGAASGSQGLLLTARSKEWITTDHEGLETGRGELGDPTPFATRSLGNGMLVGSQSWVWIGSEGVRARSRGRQGAVSTPEDRHTIKGFASGRSVFIVEDQQLVRIDLPDDVVAEVSVGDRVLVQGQGIHYLVGIDGVEKLADSVRSPVRTHYARGWKADGGLVEQERVVFVQKDSTLVEWSPSELAHVVLSPSEPRRVEEQKVEGFQTYNPRDDYAEPGLQIDGEVVHALRGRYGGDYGAAGDAVAVLARRGAIVTLEDCELIRGGVRVEGFSTVIARRCKLSAGRYEARPGSHLVLIDCTLHRHAKLVGSVTQSD